MVDKIENMEPALAHMIPEGAGHLVLPVVSLAALAVLLGLFPNPIISYVTDLAATLL